MNPIYNITSSHRVSFNIHCSVFLPSIIGSTRRALIFRHFDWTLVLTANFVRACYMPFTSHVSWFDHHNNMRWKYAQVHNWEPNRKWSNMGIKYCTGIQMQSRGESRWRAWPASFRIRGLSVMIPWPWFNCTLVSLRLSALCGWTELEAQDTIDVWCEYRKL
jgi:hypothetical protein